MADNEESQKLCRRCNQTKSLDCFGRDKSRPDGKNDRCKLCINTHNQNFWKTASPELLKKRDRWRAKYNKSDLAKQNRKRNSKKSHRSFSSQFHCSVSRAKRVGLVWDIPKETYRSLRSNPCHYCGGPLPETSTGLDRKDNAGGYTLDNVVPCCSICNYGRRDHFTFHEMERFIGPAVRKVRELRKTKNDHTTA